MQTFDISKFDYSNFQLEILGCKYIIGLLDLSARNVIISYAFGKIVLEESSLRMSSLINIFEKKNTNLVEYLLK